MVNYIYKRIKLNLMKIVCFFILSCLVCSIFITSGLLNAQTFAFNSGSTGANGPFPPNAAPPGTTSITVDLNNGTVTYLPNDTFVTLPNTPLNGFSDGILNFTTVNLPSGITLTFIKHPNNSPITILATSDVVIDGIIDVSGKNGGSFKTTGLISLGGEGGPGGFNGGNGGAKGETNNVGSAGHGPGGGTPGMMGIKAGGGGFGANSDFVTLIPLFGGSGGGGGFTDFSSTGPGGGGGGGAILIASSTIITINGNIEANGGMGTGCRSVSNSRIGSSGGGGSGGAIRLVAKTIAGSGSINANLGAVVDNSCAQRGSSGRIRLEAFTQTFSGLTNPAPSVSVRPGPVARTSNPPLSLLPTLTISSVAGVNTPAVGTSSLGTPDLALPQGTTNPVPVILTTNNIPTGITFTVRVTPQFGSPVNVNSTVSVETGNPGEATATAQINLPVGEIAILSAFADFTIQTASLFPIIDGDKIDRIMVATNVGEESRISFVTESGQMISEDKMFQTLDITRKKP